LDALRALLDRQKQKTGNARSAINRQRAKRSKLTAAKALINGGEIRRGIESAWRFSAPIR
jgi:hypothetical protein